MLYDICCIQNPNSNLHAIFHMYTSYSTSLAMQHSHFKDKLLALAHSRCYQKTTSNRQIQSSKHLRILILSMFGLDKRPGNRRSCQDCKAHNREYHSHSRSHHTQICCQTAEGSWEKTLHCGADHAVDYRPAV